MSANEEFKNMDVGSLKSELVKSRRELLSLRFRHAAGSLANTASLGSAKKKIARIMTYMAQKS